MLVLFQDCETSKLSAGDLLRDCCLQLVTPWAQVNQTSLKFKAGLPMFYLLVKLGLNSRLALWLWAGMCYLYTYLLTDMMQTSHNGSLCTLNIRIEASKREKWGVSKRRVNEARPWALHRRRTYMVRSTWLSVPGYHYAGSWRNIYPGSEDTC